MRLLIIDYEMGNLGSVKRAFEKCGADVFVSDDPKDIKKASHIILPGVGAFSDGIANLNKKKWMSAIRNAVIKDRIPMMGICLGMQLLADKGYEGGETEGLGLISGEVRLLERKSQNERIPHVGWNEVYVEKNSLLFFGIPNGIDFYFVHSYQFIPTNKENILALTPYCGGFVSAVMSDNVFGVQFHPEKSSRYGFQLIQNFLKLKRKR